ncbi:uncharacterized protein LOC110711340 [Chenopodium quinoa]|uniref:uncharacterized protein LOC110711340 n=1 Tax=Chenopodium quinoa TaxID=63459 RepID=UPI000B7764F5|nr:uncharacterized protein LOC110711340 [Chenopodium quinoa]
MASTGSSATPGSVFAPPIGRFDELKSQEDNGASFRVYATAMSNKMNNHLEFLEQGISRVMKNKKEKEETTKKKKQQVVRDGCGEWPVMIVESNSDEVQSKYNEGSKAEKKREDTKQKIEDLKDGAEEKDEPTEKKKENIKEKFVRGALE